MFILEHVVRKRLDLTQAEFSLDRFKIITLKLQRGEEGKEAATRVNITIQHKIALKRLSDQSFRLTAARLIFHRSL